MNHQEDNSRINLNVGCDDGHFAVKVCAGENLFLSIPSRAAIGRFASTDISGNRDLSRVYETAENEYITVFDAGEHDMGIVVDTRTADFPLSSANRALVNHALRKLLVENGLDPKSIAISLISGLPINRFYTEGGGANHELIEGKTASLLRPVKAEDDLPLPLIESHSIISEAVASYFDVLLNFDGSYNKKFKELSDQEPIAVVDIGGKTLDIAAIRAGGRGIHSNQSGTTDMGALYLYDLVDAALRQRFNIKEPIPFNRLERTIKTKSYNLWGDDEDVSELIDHHLDAFADRIAAFVAQNIGDATRFGRVLFVGGGANLLQDRLDRVFPSINPKAITTFPDSDDPRVNASFANARGMYKAILLASR